MSEGEGVVRVLSNNSPFSNTKQVYREKLSLPKSELVLSQFSNPWDIVKRIICLVIVTYLLSQAVLMIGFGLILNSLDGIILSFGGLFCSLPLLFIFFWIRRPRLIHIQMAIPDDNGSKTHILPNNETLTTPIPTKFYHHLVKNSGLLDIPPSKKLWLIFSVVLLFSIFIFISLINNSSDLMILLTVLFVIPAWLAGFSIPVFAWWSYSTRNLNLPTTGYKAESTLVAGMICTIPALFINTGANIYFSDVFGIDSPITQFLTLALVAPIGEELCKLGAVWWCKGYIDSPRRGFEIGFTVGLGFAMLENLQYIALSWTGGPLSFTLTSLIRGIGSIPGHAFWTGLTGIGFAYFISKNNRILNNNNQNYEISNWQLIDSKTNEIIETTLKNDKDALPFEDNFSTAVKNVQNLEKNSSKLPKNVIFCTTLAILGHSFWNGSSFVVDYFSNEHISNIAFSTLTSLVWITFLITSLFILGKLILKNVILLPDKMV